MERTPDLIRDEVSRNMTDLLENDSDLRDKLLVWRLRSAAVENNSRLDINFLVGCIQRLWDGLRGLPYSNEDIGVAIGNCVALYLYRQNIAQPSYDSWL